MIFGLLAHQKCTPKQNFLHILTSGFHFVSLRLNYFCIIELIKLFCHDFWFASAPKMHAKTEFCLFHNNWHRAVLPIVKLLSLTGSEIIIYLEMLEKIKCLSLHFW
jgi:hypothetical protein